MAIGDMNEDSLAANYDPTPLLQMFSKMFGQSQMPQQSPLLAPPAPTPQPGGVNMQIPSSQPTMMPPAQPQTPFSSMLQPAIAAKGGSYGVDSSQAQGGTGKQTDDPNAQEAKNQAAPLSPAMLQMLQAMMPKPPAPYLAPAGHVGAPAQVNLQIPGTMAPTLGQLLRGGV